MEALSVGNANDDVGAILIEVRANLIFDYGGQSQQRVAMPMLMPVIRNAALPFRRFRFAHAIELILMTLLHESSQL